jgi:alpha-amylase/alpha-mannosidase (GH57 family)
MKNLNVLFLWHMHQPLYQTGSEPFRMPWVRLHATKDYAGMAGLTEKSGRFRMTFNFSPVLWDQIADYGNGATDRELDVSLKSTAALSMEDRRFILSKMFTGNPVSIINPHPRYAELYDRYGRGGEDAAYRITAQDITDLVAWRILAWINPAIRQSHPVLSAMEKKSNHFSEQDIHGLVKESRKILRSLHGAYNRLEQSGQIEMVTSPYYHPILPLVIDSEAAVTSAGMSGTFPAPFTFYQDALWHVETAAERHRELFGKLPEGMWPAEGSVSLQAAELFAASGIQWIASDEAIIRKTLRDSPERQNDETDDDPELIYQPFSLKTDRGDITIFFRDRLLSDLIGFDYQSLGPDEAIRDFVSRLNHIRSISQSLDVEPCVSIILDGENAWEHYPDGGFPFLHALLTAVSEEPGLQLNTFSGYLQKRDKASLYTLSDLKAGSWISGDFAIWIGQKEENTAWTSLCELDQALARISDEKHGSTENLQNARQFVRKAQGSDSFWWYGDVHYTREKMEFDAIFRSFLMQGYEAAGLIPPPKLHVPIAREDIKKDIVTYPNNLISPKIDGDIKSYFDWFGAGRVPYGEYFSAMHRGSDSGWSFKELKFGFDISRLYLRLDPVPEILKNGPNRIALFVRFNDPSFSTDLDIRFVRQNQRYECDEVIPEDPSKDVGAIEVAFDRVIEISVPFSFLQIDRDRMVSFHIEFRLNDLEAGRIPDSSEIEFYRPTEDYDSILWRV